MSGHTPIPEAYRSKTPEQAMAHLAEELAEAMTAAAKSLRFGFWCHNPELPPAEQESNFIWLRREMTDVVRAYIALGSAVDGEDFASELAADVTAPETAAELERVREINAELVGALKSLRSRPGHYIGCTHPDTPCTPGCLRINAALARAETSLDTATDDDPRDAVREIDGTDGWSDPDEGAR